MLALLNVPLDELKDVLGKLNVLQDEFDRLDG